MTRMKFAEALASGLPIRRAAWLEAPREAIAEDAAVRDYVWIAIVALTEPGVSPFVSLLDGGRVTLSRIDYLAADWEVLGDDMN